MEIAFVSANRLKVELHKKRGGFISRVVNIFTQNSSQYIATMLVGNNIALVVYGIFFAKLLEAPLQTYISNSVYIVLLIQTLISTAIILLTAEFLPKMIFRRNANLFLNNLSIPVFVFYVLFYPIAAFTVFLSEALISKVFRIKKAENATNNVFGKVDLTDLLYDDSDGSKMNERDEDNEIKIFRNALDFSEITMRECLKPRNELIAVEVNSDLDDVKQKLINTGFSKILIYEDIIDNIVGYIHLMDIIKQKETISDAIEDINIFPETMYANEALQKLIQNKKSIALVVDEFGGTSGIVTIEDILEEIFGEIEDEHDKPELTEKQISETEYIFSGRLEIDYLNSKYNFSLPESEEFETIAGYLLNLSEKILSKNEVIESEPYKFIILKTDYPKIITVKLIIEEK